MIKKPLPISPNTRYLCLWSIQGEGWGEGIETDIHFLTTNNFCKSAFTVINPWKT